MDFFPLEGRIRVRGFFSLQTDTDQVLFLEGWLRIPASATGSETLAERGAAALGPNTFIIRTLGIHNQLLRREKGLS